MFIFHKYKEPYNLRQWGIRIDRLGGAWDKVYPKKVRFNAAVYIYKWCFSYLRA